MWKTPSAQDRAKGFSPLCCGVAKRADLRVKIDDEQAL
jgi:hypothetical protein